MIWDIMQTKIQATGLALTGHDLFLNEMPGNVAIGVAIKEPLTGVRIDPYLPGYYRPTIQIVIRHSDPVAGERNAKTIMRALWINGEEIHPATAERGPVRLLQFYPREMPIRYPRLDGGTIEWSINFITAFSICE